MNHERGLIPFNVLHQKWQDELYDPEPVEVQREFQASIKWAQDVLVTVFDQRMCMPEITLVRSNVLYRNKITQILEALDGCQRTLSLLRFKEGKYKTSPKTTFNGTTIGDCYYYQLPKDARKHFDEFELSAVIYNDKTTASEKAEIFFKLNNGNPLTRPQKRNAIRSEAATFIRSIARIGVAGSKTDHAVEQHELFYYDRHLANDKNPSYKGKWLVKFKGMNYDSLAARMLMFLIKDTNSDGTNFDYNDNAIDSFYNTRSMVGADGIKGRWVEHKQTMIELLDELLPIVKALHEYEYGLRNDRGAPPRLKLTEALSIFIALKRTKDQNLMVTSHQCFAVAWHTMIEKLINESDPNLKDSFVNIMSASKASALSRRCKYILDYIRDNKNDFSLRKKTDTIVIKVDIKRPETLTL